MAAQCIYKSHNLTTIWAVQQNEQRTIREQFSVGNQQLTVGAGVRYQQQSHDKNKSQLWCCPIIDWATFELSVSLRTCTGGCAFVWYYDPHTHLGISKNHCIHPYSGYSRFATFSCILGIFGMTPTNRVNTPLSADKNYTNDRMKQLKKITEDALSSTVSLVKLSPKTSTCSFKMSPPQYINLSALPNR